MAHKSIIFGPIKSRRLGFSLGIDLVPNKTCNLDCLYCEVGKTTCHSEERKTFIDLDKLVNEIKACPHHIDCLTLTGSGEPTLHKDLDIIISRLKSEFPYPIVLITNSLLLRDANVRQEIIGVDIIMPSLDAVSQDVFEKVNKPVPGVLAADIIEGLIQFRSMFLGKMWLEILFVKGINDSPSEVLAFKRAINAIRPDRVQLNTVVRVPAYKEGVGPLSVETLEAISDVLDFENIDILSLQRGAHSGQSLTVNEVSAARLRRPDIDIPLDPR
jgi:wyosine [tRNA(Phe)-imidazoG37] synthetase (radical SAM superfamily)